MSERRGWDGTKAARLAPVVVATYGDRCWLCGGPIDMTASKRSPLGLSIDHVRPRSMGGGDDIDNLRPAHFHCNVRRGARPPKRASRPQMTAQTWPGFTRSQPTGF